MTMYHFEDISLVTTQLPEDILKKKWAGDLDGAVAAIDTRLSLPIPSALRALLSVEREIIRRMEGEYTLPPAEAFGKLSEAVADFSHDEFEALEREGWLDFIYIRGEKYYFKRFFNSLMKVHRGLAARAGKPHTAARPLLDASMREMKERGSLGYRFTMRESLRVSDDVFIPGERYLVHLPLPQSRAQQSNVRVLTLSPQAHAVDKEDGYQRTVCFEKTLTQNERFSLEYRYDNVMHYADPVNAKMPAQPLYPNNAAPCADDLGEQLPHIAFSPYLKALHLEIKGEETDKVKLARRFYDFVTTKVTYAFVRQYFLIEHGAEYAAVNLRGDCGLQALLFITLCRLSGIPARWQSGFFAAPDDVGWHDWAQFYVEGWGWLFADCSFGGTAYRAGALERWDFYFGNLDPFRMAANSRYNTQFTPPKRHMRVDPYDNQDGECECESRGFLSRELHTEQTMLAHEKITD